jgi:hypothetical protein
MSLMARPLKEMALTLLYHVIARCDRGNAGMKRAMWTTPLIAASGSFVGAVLACYQVTGDWLAPASAVEGHLGYVASVTGAFGAVSAIASLLFISPDDE